MCGLSGYITKKNTVLNPENLRKRGNIFNGLLIAMQDRGDQSAGVAFIRPNRFQIVKAPFEATKFVQLNRYRYHLNLNYPLVIGHTRLATSGDVSKRNAHPFRRGDIIGTHNGQVWNFDDLNKGSSLNVDSEIIFQLLAESENDFKASFKKLRGNFALAWTKLVPNDYNLFLAVDGNPLHFAYVAELKTMFWASTEMALLTVLSSHYKSPKIWSIKEGYCIEYDSNLIEKNHKVQFKSFETYSGYSGDQQNCKKCRKAWWNCKCIKPSYIDDIGVKNDVEVVEDSWVHCDICSSTVDELQGYITENNVVVCNECVKEKHLRGVIPLTDVRP